jgi:ribosomal protein S18 acetylase RimI-like enzyme
MPALLGEGFGPHRATYAALEEFWRRFPGLGPSGALIVESSDGEIAATVSTRVEVERLWIHLVAVSGQHRRRGLATFAILSALDAHAGRGIDSAWVGTAAHRLAAIRLYLGLGFEVVDP